MQRAEVMRVLADAESVLPAVPGQFEIVEVPECLYLMVDGEGDHESSVAFGQALNWLYGVSYQLKFSAKAKGRDYAVGALQGRWRAQNLSEFSSGRRDRWQWTLMMAQPEFITPDDFAAAREKVAAALGVAPVTLRMETYCAGLAVQVLQIGPVADQGALVNRMHGDFMRAHNLAPQGDYHEIYLTDLRRTPQSRMRTILRQPVASIAVSMEHRMDKARTVA